MTKPKTDRAIKEEEALQSELTKLQFEYSEIVDSLNDKYRALKDLLSDETEYFNKLDNDDKDFFGV